MALRDGNPYMAWGTPGGDQMDQWSCQMFLRHASQRNAEPKINLQQAIDAPAWHIEHFPLSECAVRVYGGKVIGIDPVNEIDHQVPGGENKTDYWGRFIMRVKQLADDYELLVIACAPPPKDGVEKRMMKNRLLTLN